MCPSGGMPRRESAGKSGFQTAFEVLDADRDGKISPGDLRTFYTDLYGAPDTTTEEDIGSMISAADSNKDGFVELDELERILDCERSSSPRSLLMEEVFKVMDKDGDGKVGFDDLKTYMKSAGFTLSDEDITAMIKLGGGDESGGVFYEDLLKILSVDLAEDYVD